MKRAIWMGAVGLLSVVAYTVAGPYITVHQIRIGVEKQDLEKLSENIDFPLLRQNLKEQLNALMMKEIVAELEDNPFSALALGLAPKLADGMVESFITPAGLANLMEGNKPTQGDVSKPLNEPNASRRQLFENARYAFDSTSKFSVSVIDGNGEEVRFVLNRNGLHWKLSNIVIADTNRIGPDTKERKRVQALAEIKGLEEKKARATEARANLAKLEVVKSRFYKREGLLGPEPIVELTVRNGTAHAVSRAYFVGTLASSNRPVPWLTEMFNYSISGGLQPGEKASWDLAPNPYSAWAE